MKTLKLTMFAAAALTATMLHATEYFVDCTRPDDTGDGLSEATAKRTIQAAIAAAEADAAVPRIVTVLPGTYAEGGGVVGYACDKDEYKGKTLACTNRVYITKALTLRAKDPAQLTEIVGAWHTGAGASSPSTGIGPAAVRCLYVTTSSRVIVKGFTLRDGAAQDDNRRITGGYWPTFAGGAIGDGNTYLVDCAIRHCSGPRGAAAYGCRLVRCKVVDSYGSSLSHSTALHSLIMAQQASGYSFYAMNESSLYGCTFFYNGGNSGSYLSDSASGQRFCNSLVFGIPDSLTHSGGRAYVTNSVCDCYWAGLGTYANSTFNYDDGYYMFKSPLDEDFRVRSDMSYLAIGDASVIAGLNWPDEVEPFKDLNGNAIPTSGTIMPGCVQETFTPVCGAIVLSRAKTIVDGSRKSVCPNLYFYADDKFAQHKLTVELAEGQFLHSWSALYGDWRRFPAVDDSLMVMPPYDANTRSVNTPAITSQVLYVSPSGNDDTGDGSQANPYKTLLKAGVAAQDRYATSKSLWFVVFAAPGTYDEGSTNVCGGLNRVYDFGNYIRFVGAGAYGDGKSVIAGALDPDATETARGRGPKAIRCAALNVYQSCLQNFEVKDGRVKLTDGGVTAGNQGGGIYGGCMIDCHVINCGAARGQIAYNGRIERCRVTTPDPCGSGRPLETGNGYALSCILEDTADLGCDWGDSLPYLQCTFHTLTTQRLIGSGSKIFNSASTPASSATSSHHFSIYGLVGYAGVVQPKAGSPDPDYLNADPCFVDYANGDFRIKSQSLAIGYGSLKSMSSTSADTGYWKTYGPDFNGNKILFFDGKPLPGAVQEIVQGVSIAKPAYGTITPCGETYIEPGESITVTLSDCVRPYIGLLVNGVLTNVMTLTIAAPATPSGKLAISALVSTNWYVNAAMPDDSGDGFTPATAKKTLVGVFTNQYLAAGDVVHAARGDYNEGKVKWTSTSTIFERVIMKEGTSLVADEGQDVTFISGEGAPEGQRETFNGWTDLGVGATRPVFMNANTRLVGFTVRNGRTRGTDKSGTTNKDNHGGGVMAAGGTSCLIEDCCIISNASRRAGAGSGGTWRRCKFYYHNTDICNDYQAFGGFFSCFFDYNGACVQTFPMVNCCVGPNGTANYAMYAVSGAKIINTISYKSVRLTSGGSGLVLAPTNCVFTAWTVGSEAGAGKSIDATLITKKTSAQINNEFDLATMTIKNKDGFLTDAGHEVARSYSKLGGMDINGSQRVYNGAIDIGPGEYDWRGEYATALGAAEVTAASPDVTLTDAGKVRMTDGTALCFEAAKKFNKLPFEIEGGTLTVGEREFDESGICKFRSPATLALSFAGVDVDAYADLGALQKKRGILVIAR